MCIKEGDLQEEEVLSIRKLTNNQVSHCLDKH